jgi:hypothetical protein
MRHITPINRMMVYGDCVAVWWQSGAKDIRGHFAAIWRVAPAPKPRRTPTNACGRAEQNDRR